MSFSKQLLYESLYGQDTFVLDRDSVKRFINESSQVQGVYSDEGLYDFFASFKDYKRVTAANALKVIGWPVIDYLLDEKARDPFFQTDMMEDDGPTGDEGRVDTNTYGGSVVAGERSYKKSDKMYMKEMDRIMLDLGWEIVNWMGIGPNRKSKVVVIPSYAQTTMDAKVNEDIVIRVQMNEVIKKVDGKYVVYPEKGGKRLGTHSTKEKAMAQLTAIELSKKGIKKESDDYTFGPDWIPTSLAQRKKMKRIHGKLNRSIREQENNIKKLIAVYPGRFQPFGPHHKASYEFLKSRYDEVYIVTSGKTGGARHPMNFAQKKKHMIKMGIPSKAIVQEKQPYIPKKLLSKFDGDTTAVVFAVGEKDEGRLTSGKYFKPYRKNYNRLQGFDNHGYTLQIPHTSIKVGGMEISGTTMRKLLGSEKFDLKAKEKFFKKLFGYFDQKTFDLFTNSFQEAIKLDVEVGDTILVGRFKNKKMKVKSIGKDEHGMPTINGRKIVTFRKLVEDKEQIKTLHKFLTKYTKSAKKASAMINRNYKRVKKQFRGDSDRDLAMALIGYDAIGEDKLKRKELLLMGGAYGHMAHPFDDYALTFGELKDIIDLGLQGKLDKEEAVTEKLDGQNIMISVIDGKAVAARNKGDLKRGGMSLKGVQAKFANHIPSVRDAFVFSMKDIASSVEKMSKKDSLALFNNGKNWANIEIIYPENKNVIDYDGGATIVFHGILKYNQAWIPSGEVKSGGAKLASIINKLNKQIKTKFAFKGPNVITLHKDKDYSAKKGKYIGALNNLQNIYRLKDSDELSLYHQHFWLEYILNGANSSDYSNIPDNVLYPLMKRWAFSDKSYKMTEINKLKDEYPKFVDWVKTTEKLDHKKMLKDNMKPFEEIFFGVGAEILANASNFLSVSPDKTAKKLVDDLNKAAKSLSSKKDFSNIDKLKTQLQRLKAMPDLSKAAPSEGLVFKYNGKVYKFTGFFAPINQILGLEKFSR